LKIIIALILTNTLLSAFFENVSNFQSKFRQTITSDGKDIIYEGELYIKRPSSVLWLYQKPIRKSIYIRDHSLFMIEPDLEQVIIKSISKSLQLVKILESSKKISANRYVATIKDKKYLIILKKSMLFRIIYSDEVENSIEITFIDPRVDIEINDKKFFPNIPSDFDRIYQ